MMGPSGLSVVMLTPWVPLGETYWGARESWLI